MHDIEHAAQDSEVWGPYANYDDVARFQYGRMLWRQPAVRACLLANWLNERHPYRERFLAKSRSSAAVQTAA